MRRNPRPIIVVIEIKVEVATAFPVTFIVRLDLEEVANVRMLVDGDYPGGKYLPPCPMCAKTWNAITGAILGEIVRVPPSQPGPIYLLSVGTRSRGIWLN